MEPSKSQFPDRGPNYDPRTWRSMGYRADDAEHSPNASGAGISSSQPVVGVTPEGN